MVVIIDFVTAILMAETTPTRPGDKIDLGRAPLLSGAAAEEP
jgi:hypothetical protein